mgnify:CR=1 FL=1
MIRFRTSVLLLIFFVSTSLTLSGCDLFEVDNPQELPTQQIDQDEQLLPAVVNGVEGRFAGLLDQSILFSGLVADELRHTGSFPSFGDIDRGVLTAGNAEINPLYSSGASTVWSGDDTADRIDAQLESGELDSTEEAEFQNLKARALLFGGYALVVLSENFGGVTIDAGERLSPENGFEEAITRFNESVAAAQAAVAAAQAAGDPSLDPSLEGRIANAQGLEAYAQGGIARASLNLGNLDDAFDAATAALGVGGNFNREVAYDQATNQNDIWTFMIGRSEVALGSSYPVPADADPRTATGPDEDTEDTLAKHADRGADISLVRWQEMHLIRAEVLWRGSANVTQDLNAATGELNIVRAEAGLGAFTIDTSADAPPASDQVRDQIILERAAEFFLEGRRFFDARRYLDTPFEGTTVSSWPPAEWVGSPSALQTFPIGQTEQNQNPNL